MLSKIMAVEIDSVITKRMNKQKWIIPACFWMTLVLTVLGIVLCLVRGFSGMDNRWTFSIGADVFCLAICAMLCYSCMQARQEEEEYTRIFVTLLTVNGLELFLDICCWIVQGIPSLRMANLIVNALYYTNSAVLTYFFWRYVTKSLDVEHRVTMICNSLLNLLLLPTVLLCLLNVAFPLYFSVDAAGVYQRGTYFFLSQIYLALGLIAVALGFVVSHAGFKTKMVTGSFVIIPVINQLLTQYAFGISTSYAAALVSIVLIYGVLFAEREKKIASTSKELGLATRIQADMLPNIFPAFPNRSEFDIYASMTPAKEVGGDFYDFFLIDDNHLGMVMADVSGKGVPAALFMMAAKILIRNHAMSGKSPSEVLQTVNEQICSNNREEMFVTVWFGVLELDSGVLTAANAGHEYPIVKANDGDFTLYKDKHGFVIGGMAGMKYRQYEITLEPGSKLFLYTDGVTEATNAKNELFGTDRLIAALNEGKDGTPQGVLMAVNEAVASFVQENPQFDDLTMLCLHYNGKNADTSDSKSNEITLPAEVEHIGQATDFINEQLRHMNCPKKLQTQIDTAVDEILSNIAYYAYGESKGNMTIRVEEASEPLGVILTFIDSGTPYNPLDKADPDVTLSAEEREIGGLGIFLVKKLMDEVNYQYSEGQNILTLRKNI